MIDATRLIKPTIDLQSAFDKVRFRNRRSLLTAGERILLTDPIRLADVYNSAEENAAFVRKYGLFFLEFGGDVRGPVWWQSPYVMLPVSTHLTEHDLKPSRGIRVFAESIGCDSGSFVFLPLTAHVPSEIRSRSQELIRRGNAVSLPLPAGRWTAYYEQFASPHANQRGLFRNIVLKHTLPRPQSARTAENVR